MTAQGTLPSRPVLEAKTARQHGEPSMAAQRLRRRASQYMVRGLMAFSLRNGWEADAECNFNVAAR